MYCIISFSEYMYLLVRYDTGASDNNITCEMSTLIAERLNVWASRRVYLNYAVPTYIFIKPPAISYIKIPSTDLLMYGLAERYN